MGGSQGGSPGCSRGGSLTNGELSEEQTPGSSGRRRSSKGHGSPGGCTGTSGLWMKDIPRLIEAPDSLI